MQVFQTAASLAPPVYFVATKSTTNEAANVAEPGAPVAPDKTSSKKGASQKNGPPKAKKVAKRAKRKPRRRRPRPARADKPERQAKATGPGAESKSAKLLAMIGSAKGAKLAELMKELGWQAHSVRGFISIAGKKGTKIEFSKERGRRARLQIDQVGKTRITTEIHPPRPQSGRRVSFVAERRFWLMFRANRVMNRLCKDQTGIPQ